MVNTFQLFWIGNSIALNISSFVYSTSNTTRIYWALTTHIYWALAQALRILDFVYYQDWFPKIFIYTIREETVTILRNQGVMISNVLLKIRIKKKSGMNVFDLKSGLSITSPKTEREITGGLLLMQQDLLKQSSCVIFREALLRT